jgi:hypothetical protein
MRPADAAPVALLSPLQRLAEKGAAQQWTVADSLDVGQAVQLPRWLPRKFTTADISQFYHGEMAILAMCRRVLDELDDPWARRCIEIQIADESRHAEAYRTYLAAIGDLAPPDPVLSVAYGRALDWCGPPEALIAAFNIVLEGEAIYALDYLGGWLPCPRFRNLNTHVSRDEARHLAFGRIYLTSRFAQMARDQRMEIHRWLKELWSQSAFGILDQFPIPNAVLGRRCRTWMETGWLDHRRALIGIGLVSAEEARVAEQGI